MIELRDVCFSYGKEFALQNINMRFKKGEFCAIVGPNGCGKTSLLRLIARLSQPGSGELQLSARRYSEYGRKEFAHRVGLMPQTRPIPEMTVREFVEHGRYPYMQFSQRITRTDEETIHFALSLTDVEQFSDRNLRELSGGERQRAYLALLLAQETEAMLLDEPTTYLDIAAQFSVLHVLKKMRSAGKCVIAVLHDLNLAMQFCDRIIVMHRGRVCADAAPRELADSDVWMDVFGVSCRSIEKDGEQFYIFEPKKATCV